MIELFDVQAGIIGIRTGERRGASADELVESMERFSIHKSLVRIAPGDYESDIIQSNARLYGACADRPQLVPCPIVVPNSGCDLPDEAEQVADAVAKGAGAAWVRMAQDSWFVADWISDKLFEALADRQLPVYISAEQLPVADLAKLAARFDHLAIIYANVSYRDQRVLLPLLERFRNVHLSTGLNYRVFGGIEQFVARGCGDQLLFGTGFPDSEPMAATAQLLYAKVSDEWKRHIGHGNAQRLLEGIRR